MPPPHRAPACDTSQPRPVTSAGRPLPPWAAWSGRGSRRHPAPGGTLRRRRRRSCLRRPCSVTACARSPAAGGSRRPSGSRRPGARRDARPGVRGRPSTALAAGHRIGRRAREATSRVAQEHGGAQPENQRRRRSRLNASAARNGYFPQAAAASRTPRPVQAPVVRMARPRPGQQHRFHRGQHEHTGQVAQAEQGQRHRHEHSDQHRRQGQYAPLRPGGRAIARSDRRQR